MEKKNNEDITTEELFGKGTKNRPYEIKKVEELQNITQKENCYYSIKPELLKSLLNKMEGNGTKSNPYKISIVEELQAIMIDPDSYYLQTDDIDGSKTKNWFRDNFGTIPDFSGTYDGQEYQIKNIHTDHKGLFRNTETDGIIKNVNLVDVNAKGSGLVGRNKGTIKNSYVSGNIEGNDTVGGLVEINDGLGKIIDCYSDCVINSHSDFDINDDINYDIKYDGYKVGGLVGENNGEIIESSSKGDVNGNKKVGGLVGLNKNEIVESISKSDVNGDKEVGGLVGANGTFKEGYSCNIIGSKSKSKVKGDNMVGGLVGQNFGSINYVIASGDIFVPNDPTVNFDNIGDVSDNCSEEYKVEIVDTGFFEPPKTIDPEYNVRVGKIVGWDEGSTNNYKSEDIKINKW